MPSITQQDYKRINIHPASIDKSFESWGEEAKQQFAKAVVNGTILDVVLEDNIGNKARVLFYWYSVEDDEAEISFAYESDIFMATINPSQYLPQEEIIN